MTEPTRERSLGKRARGLASGSLSRRRILCTTGGYRGVYEQFQRNAEKRSRVEEVINV
jgi:hypothetical protein